MIVEQGKTSSGWWRKWSDGFIEQGGVLSGNESTVITFHFPFSDTQYIAMATARYSGEGAKPQGLAEVFFKSKQSSRINVHAYRHGTDVFVDWYVAEY